MIVVSNTSPIMNLTIIGQLNLLNRLYGKVFIPEAVFRELSTVDSEESGLLKIQSHLWIEKRFITNRSLADALLLDLDVGEAEAIVLAKDIKADLLLIDERRGRTIASRLGLKVIGLLGVLVEVKRMGFISRVKPILDELIEKAGFWISSQLYKHVLYEVGES